MCRHIDENGKACDGTPRKRVDPVNDGYCTRHNPKTIARELAGYERRQKDRKEARENSAIKLVLELGYTISKANKELDK